jgi:hypothetical protein
VLEVSHQRLKLGPVIEQELAEPRALHALEELLGHDLIGVHVGPVQVTDATGDDVDWVHEAS